MHGSEVSQFHEIEYMRRSLSAGLRLKRQCVPAAGQEGFLHAPMLMAYGSRRTGVAAAI